MGYKLIWIISRPVHVFIQQNKQGIPLEQLAVFMYKVGDGFLKAKTSI